jgi:hypothetical protein
MSGVYQRKEHIVSTAKPFNQIRVGDTFFLTEENIPDRFIKLDMNSAMNESGAKIQLGRYVEVSPDVENPYTPAQLELMRLLDHHTGGDVYYHSNPLVPWFFHTQGVHDLAQQAECFWLINLIVSWQSDPRIRGESFQSWTLEKTLPLISPQDLKLHVAKGWIPGTSWVARCTDGGAVDEVERELCRQEINYSTFPLDSISLWVEDGTSPYGKPCKVLLLPSEH